MGRLRKTGHEERSEGHNGGSHAAYEVPDAEAERVLETALYVDDLPRARAFYEDSLGLPVLFANGRMCAFDVGGKSVLLTFLRGASAEPMHTPGGTIPGHDGTGPLHMGFAVSAEELPAWEERLREQGILSRAEPLGPRAAPASISGIRTGTCSNWRRRASGRHIEIPQSLID
jgi:catechol 2,3-dioxygenase-like lactoylglutathione lyase family enzyme